MRTMRHLLCVVALAGIVVAADSSNRKVVRHEEATYPELAQKANIHGAVKIKIWIAPDGSVRRTEYIGGHPLLAEAALKAVKVWQYERAAEESTTVVEIRF